MKGSKLTRIAKLQLINEGVKNTPQILKEKEEDKWKNYKLIYNNIPTLDVPYK